jgi:hypothetical protein
MNLYLFLAGGISRNNAYNKDNAVVDWQKDAFNALTVGYGEYIVIDRYRMQISIYLYPLYQDLLRFSISVHSSWRSERDSTFCPPPGGESIINLIDYIHHIYNSYDYIDLLKKPSVYRIQAH